MKIINILIIICCLFVSCVSSPNIQQDGTEITWKQVGEIAPRHAREIIKSNWSVGAEMMDRDFTIYKYWKDYLGQLGVKKARIQSGWAKTEREKGIYSWEWLDEIIYDMVEQKVEPWVNLCYGNPLYAGGGGTLLNAYIPKSDESVEAWKNYVRATVKRYADYVTDWEIWNEPNYRISVEDYADFLILTSEIIRQEDSKANIIGFAIGSGVDYRYVDKVMTVLKQKGKIDVIDEISHHRHIPIPDKRDPEIELEKVVKKYSDRIKIRQGEAGCPSEFSTQFALRNYRWNEQMQAKHVLRRLLTDLGHGKESCVFTIMDAKDVPKGWNRKGLLKSKEDQTVDYPKPAYYAVQHLTSVFDDQLELIKNYRYAVETVGNFNISLYAFKNNAGNQVVTMWFNDKTPSDKDEKSYRDFTFYEGKFDQPVWVDMVSGKIYEIPKQNIKKNGTRYNFIQIPIYDTPVLIADKLVLNLK